MMQRKKERKAPGAGRGDGVQDESGGGARFDVLPTAVCLIELYQKPRLAEFDATDRELAEWLGRRKKR